MKKQFLYGVLVCINMAFGLVQCADPAGGSAAAFESVAERVAARRRAIATPMHDDSCELWLTRRRAQLMEHIDKEQEFVRLSSPFLSDSGVITALIRAHERGVCVTVKVGACARGLERLQAAGIEAEVVKGLHAKMVITSQATILGSDNWSQFSRIRDTEVAARVKHKRRSFADQSAAAFNSLRADAVHRATPKSTPKKPTIARYSIGYMAERLRRFITEKGAGNSADIFSMTFNSVQVVEVIEEIYSQCAEGERPRIRLFLDRSALTHRDLLDRMLHAGGDSIEIYLFNISGDHKLFGSIPNIMHQKALVRTLHAGTDRVERHVILPTGNLTSQSHNELNLTLDLPGAADIHQSLSECADSYARSDEWTRYETKAEDE